jgi:hypothetical protein
MKKAAAKRSGMRKAGSKKLVKISKASAAIAIPAGAAILNAAPASAYCVPGRANNYSTGYYDGVNHTEPYKGVLANIEEYTPFVYSIGNDDTTDWVMLCRNCGDRTTSKFVQIGREEFSDERAQFVSVKIPGHGYSNLYSDQNPNGEMISYKVDYNPACTVSVTKCFTTYLAGSETGSYSKWKFNPQGAEIDTEIHTKASQVPGGYDNNNIFSNIHVEWQSRTSWSTPSTSPEAGTTWSEHNVSPITGGFKTWDAACST